MKSPLDNPIAQQHYVWVHPDGKETAVIARIGAPVQDEGTTWRCAAALEGVDGQYADIYGEGSMQPLGLALRHIRTRLLALLEEGAVLYYPEDRSEPVTADYVNVVFGGHGQFG